MLYASETWSLTKANLQRFQRNDRAMIRHISSIKPEDVPTLRSSELNLILRERRIWGFGHVEHSSCAVRAECDIQIDDRRGSGRPNMEETDRERLPHDS